MPENFGLFLPKNTSRGHWCTIILHHNKHFGYRACWFFSSCPFSVASRSRGNRPRYHHDIMTSSWQSFAIGLQSLVAILVVGFVCWQTRQEISYSKKDHVRATQRLVEIPFDFVKDVPVDNLPVATKKKKRKLRYYFHDSDWRTETLPPSPAVSPDYVPTPTTSSGGKGSAKSAKGGGKGSKNEIEGDCSIDLSVNVGPFVATPNSIQCTSNLTSLDLIYTAKNCSDGGFACQSNATGERPLFNCQDDVSYLPSSAILVAYDTDNVEKILFNGKVFRGRPFTLFNEGKPLDRVTVETYIDNRADPAQSYSFRLACDLFRIGCFTGLGGTHIVGWEEDVQGTITCPRGEGTRTLKYTVDFSAVVTTNNQIFDLVYSEYATIAPISEVTPITELIGLRIDPSATPSYTVGGFNASVTAITNTTSKFTVLGLTVPERDLCAAALPFTIQGPSAQEFLDGLCTDNL